MNHNAWSFIFNKNKMNEPLGRDHPQHHPYPNWWLMELVPMLWVRMPEQIQIRDCVCISGSPWEEQGVHLTIKWHHLCKGRKVGLTFSAPILMDTSSIHGTAQWVWGTANPGNYKPGRSNETGCRYKIWALLGLPFLSPFFHSVLECEK
jgi:hypothetical protein